MSGSSNPAFTNNTTKNVRIVINYMESSTSGEITLTWGGNGYPSVSVNKGNVEAIGRNLACASGFYGDWGFSGWLPFGWWKKISQTFYPTTATSAQNLAVRLPGVTSTIDVDFTRKGWKKFLRDGSTTDVTLFSYSVAFPTEIFLKAGQTFSAVCGVYNIIALTED